MAKGVRFAGFVCKTDHRHSQDRRNRPGPWTARGRRALVVGAVPVLIAGLLALPAGAWAASPPAQPGAVRAASPVNATPVNATDVNASPVDTKNAEAQLDKLLNTPAARSASAAQPARRSSPADATGGSCGSSAGTESCYFAFNGDDPHSSSAQTFTVPIGVTQVTTDLWGARSAGNGTDPGNGGHVAAAVDVYAGEVLDLYVGGIGTGTSGGWPDGGNVSTTGAGTGCAAGGGTRLTGPAGDIAEAGGGGGCGGGDQRGKAGDAGLDAGNGGGGGGCGGGGGAGATTTGAGGGGGGYSGTCAGLIDSEGSNGGAGSGHAGGAGGGGNDGWCCDHGYSGGGGGGGWFGGGGGGGGGHYGGGGGGGGGGLNGWNPDLVASAYATTDLNNWYGYAVVGYPLLPTTTALTVTPSVPSTVGGTVTVTAHVTHGAGQAVQAGSVTFSGADNVCGPVAVDTGTGIASCAFTTTSVADSTIQASYAQVGAYDASSSTASLSVAKDNTTTIISSVTPSGTSASIGVAVALVPLGRGTLNGAPINPTVSIQASGASDAQCSFSVSDSHPTGSCVLNSLVPGGSYTYAATYAGTPTTNSSGDTLSDRILPRLATTTTMIAGSGDVQGNPIALTALTVAVPSSATTVPVGAVELWDSPTATSIDPAAGAVRLCSVPVTGSGGFYSPSSADLATCNVAPALVGASFLIAAYGGDAETVPSRSAGAAYTTAAAGTKLVLSAIAGGSPLSGTLPSNTPISLTAAVTYTSAGLLGSAATGGTVTFDDGGTPITCTTVTNSGRTCTFAPKIRDGAARVFTADFSGVPGYSTASTAGNTISVTLTAPASSLNFSSVPVAVDAGAPVTLTVTLQSADPAVGAAGYVNFYDAANKQDPICSVVRLAVPGLTASCVARPAPGTTVNYFAKYTGDPNIGADVETGTQPKVTAGAAGSTVSARAVSGSTFGDSVPLAADIASAVTYPRAQPVGTVTFTQGATVLCAIAVQRTGPGTATAACRTTALAGGTDPVVATFISSGPATTGSVSAAVSAHVDPAAATVHVAAEVATDTTAVLSITVTGGLPVVPSGTVSVTVAGAPVAGCSALALTGGTVSCSPTRPTAAGDYLYTADYTPGDGDFAAATGTASLHVADGNVLCSGGFRALDLRLQANRALNLGTAYANLTGTVDPVSACTQATMITFSNLTATLFGTVAGSVAGHITQDGGFCLTGGTFGSAPQAAWVTGTYRITTGICFSLGQDGNPDGILGGTLSTTAPQPVPLVHLGGLGTVDVTLTFSHAAGVPARLTLSTTLTTTSGPTAAVTGSIAADGSASLALTTSNLNLFGSALALAGSIDRDAAGAVTYSASAALAGPLTPAGAPGLSFTDIGVSLSNDGLDLTGTGALGAADASLAVTLHATINNARTWTLTLTTSGDPWSPIGGLSVSTALTGTVSYDASRPKPYSYDFTGGNGTDPFVTWTTQSGAAVTVTKVELSSTATCAGAGTGDPVLALDGSASAGGTSAFTVGVSGCVDLATSAFDLTGTADGLTIAPGLVLEHLSVDLSGSNVAATLTGSATAAVDSGGTALSVPMRLNAGTGTGRSLVIGGAADLSSVGLPVVGFVAFASAAVDSYDTGLTEAQLPGGSQISLAKGLTARGVVTLDTGTAADLAAVGVTSGATLTFAAALGSASSAAFELNLDIPTLELYHLTVTDVSATASFAREAGVNTFRLAVRATVPSESGNAELKLDLAYAPDHTLTGTGSLTNFSVFGHPLSLTGTFTHAAGKLTGSLALAPVDLTIPLPAGAAVTVTGFTAVLATDGLSVAGTVAVPGAPGGLSVTGTLHNLRNYAITVFGTLPGWSPTPGVVIAQNTLISGTLSSASTTATPGHPSVSRTTVDLRAAGNLLTLSPVGAVSLSVTSIELSNGVPVGCSVTRAGDLWLGVSGTVSATIGTTVGVTAVGCFDVSSGALSLTAALPIAYAAPGGNVSIHDAVLAFAKSGAAVTVSARATLTIAFDQAFNVSAVLEFTGSGFLVGAGIDMGKYLGAGAVAAAYVFFASTPANAVPTDELGNFGPQNFAQGITVLGKVSIPAALADWLRNKGIDVPADSSLVAKGVLDLANRAITLSISVDLGAGQQLFSAGGTSLALDSGGLELSISPTLVSFGLVVSATLTVAPPTTDACNTTDNTIGLTGRISLTGQSVTGSFTVSHWQNALGICGLTVDEFTVQLGIDAEGIPSLGFVVQVSSLPVQLAEAIGYQSGTILKLAVNISVDNFLVDIEIGTKGSGQAALKPLTVVNQPDLLVVNYAQLYISPNGAKVGGTVYPAGFALIFNASVKGVTLDFDLEVNPAKLSLHFDATVGQIHVGGLTFGPTEIILDAQGTSPLRFDFEFKGEIHVGPGTVDVGPLLRFSGHLDAAVDISVGTSGFAASITADAFVQGSNYLPQSTCWYQVIFPYPCDYTWVDDAPLNIPRFTIGIAINSDGIDLQVPGIDSKIHLPFSSNHAVPAAFVVGRSSIRTDNFDPGGDAGPWPASAGGDAPPVAASGEDSVVGHPYAIRVQPAVLTLRPQGFGTVGQPASVMLRQQGFGTVRQPASVMLGPGTEEAAFIPGLPVAAQNPAAGAPAVDATTPAVIDPGADSWLPARPLHDSRAFATTTVLTDGRVLVTGGGSSAQASPTAELYDPKTGTWSSTGAMPVATVGAGSVLLPDGRVLVVGGAAGSGVLAAAQLYDPATGSWTLVASMGAARQFPVATVLSGGRVLVAGGRGVGDAPLATAEIFDPATGRWTGTGSLAAGREIASGVTLPDGRVLVAAGLGAAGPLASAELYDPSTGRWSATGSVHNARFGASTTLLSDGSVLLAGDSAFAELYSPAKGTWTRTGTEHTPRTFAATVPLPGSGALTIGGFVGTAGSSSALPSASADVESYDSASKMWSVSAALPSARAGASAALLGNGTVLAAGGMFDGSGQNSAYLLTPPAQRSGSGSGSGSNGSNGGSNGSGVSGNGSGSRPAQSLSYTGVPADTRWVALGGLLSVLLGAACLSFGLRRRRTG